SFANFSIEGQLSNVLDLRDLSALEDFVAIIKKFKLTRDTRQLARKYNLPARPLVRSTQNLQDRVLAASDAWRIEPLLADIPAANQIFARYVQAAGYEGVLYPSQRGAGLCLA